MSKLTQFKPYFIKLYSQDNKLTFYIRKASYSSGVNVYIYYIQNKIQENILKNLIKKQYTDLLKNYNYDYIINTFYRIETKKVGNNFLDLKF